MIKVDGGYVWSNRKRGWKKLPRRVWHRIQQGRARGAQKLLSKVNLVQEFERCAGAITALAVQQVADT